MPLSLRTDDLHRFCISATFTSGSNGSISLALKPSINTEYCHTSHYHESSKSMINFETVLEDGCYKLLVFASFDDSCVVNNTISSSSTTTEAAALDQSFLSQTPSISSDENFFQQLYADWRPHYGGSSANSFLDLLSPETWEIGDTLSNDVLGEFNEEAQSEVSVDEGSSSAPSTPSSSVSSLDDSSASSPQKAVRRPRRLKCLQSGCNRRFMSEYTRKLHMGTHGPRARFACQLGCEETFSRQHDRFRHEVSIHGRQVEWLCDRCRKCFSCQGSLAKHKCSGNTRGIAVRHIIPKP